MQADEEKKEKGKGVNEPDLYLHLSAAPRHRIISVMLVQVTLAPRQAGKFYFDTIIHAGACYLAITDTKMLSKEQIYK